MGRVRMSAVSVDVALEKVTSPKPNGWNAKIVFCLLCIGGHFQMAFAVRFRGCIESRNGCPHHPTNCLDPFLTLGKSAADGCGPFPKLMRISMKFK